MAGGLSRVSSGEMELPAAAASAFISTPEAASGADGEDMQSDLQTAAPGDIDLQDATPSPAQSMPAAAPAAKTGGLPVPAPPASAGGPAAAFGSPAEAATPTSAEALLQRGPRAVSPEALSFLQAAEDVAGEASCCR